MGRAEAFAQKNTPFISLMDGVASGLGYTVVLLVISFVRELLGFGTLFGMQVLPESFTNWTIMVMPPAAFFLLALIIWGANVLQSKKEKGKGVAKA